jgi:hypothetical protein
MWQGLLSMVKGAKDRRKIYDKNLNSHKYRAAVDDTAALFFRLDIGPQYPQKPVCMNAFRNVLALCHKPWEKLKRSVSAGSYVAGPIEHGNVGTHHRLDSSNQKRCEESIRLYLKDLADSYTDCYATRFIREKTSVGLRNTEISDQIAIQHDVQNIYCGWCYSVGYKPTADSKGNFGSVYLFEERPYNELTFPVGSQGHVCSWSSFQKIWKKYFPNMKICNRCEDVCGE